MQCSLCGNRNGQLIHSTKNCPTLPRDRSPVRGVEATEHTNTQAPHVGIPIPPYGELRGRYFVLCDQEKAFKKNHELRLTGGEETQFLALKNQITEMKNSLPNGDLRKVVLNNCEKSITRILTMNEGRRSNDAIVSQFMEQNQGS